MNREKWTEVDTYLEEQLLPVDPVLESALTESDRAGLPRYAVSPAQGMLLRQLVQIQKASRVLEIGTLGGYSTIWLARGLSEGGSVTTLEVHPDYAAVAKSNIALAGFADVVEIRIGKADETLAELDLQKVAPFDFIFIDADKQNNPEYLRWSLKLSRPGTVIVCDNVVRDGAVLDSNTNDPVIVGVRQFLEMIRKEPRLIATAIQTVGCKGYDGFVLAVVQ